ncbi:MAG: hypothetical protein QM621_14975 [Aeromicrobium sp.]|uniref:DUF7426 family protein n=1 Tax=Aeromicrobium sp. TaxID=1871063 RepID=UPI0039E3A07F
MATRDYSEVVDPDLVLPIRGKEYRIAPVDTETGLWLHDMQQIAARTEAGEEITDDDLACLRLDDTQERNYYQRVLGAAYEEMLADDVGWEALKFAAQTVSVWVMASKAEAVEFWNTGGKRPKGNRAARRKKGKKKR